MLKEEQKLQKRYVAHKVYVRDILDSEYRKVEGFDSNYLDINGKEIARINLIGIIVEKADGGSYRNIIIDDGTGKVSARAFDNYGMVDSVNVGDFALIIGRPREFSGEKYILIEIIKKVDSGWAKARRLELGAGKKHERETFEKIEASPKEKMLRIIKSMDSGQGVAIEDLAGDGDSDRLIALLLKEGEIFEIRPGRLKVLE